jgi:hypothetical protein
MLIYADAGTVFVTRQGGDTYEIPLEIWRLFNGIVEKMEGET